MNEYLLGLGTAAWLGVLTSISPCPLATNIAAVSFVARKANAPAQAMWSGVLYTAGRMLAYVVVGALVVWSVLSLSKLSFGLQKYMHEALGPFLILIGIILAGWIKLPVASGSGFIERLAKRAELWGAAGAFLLGAIFAVSFCPVSAALFFGSLIPLAAKHDSIGVFPAVYGVGTALPVLVFAGVIVFSAQATGKLYGRLTSFEKWARLSTGVVFICVGLYMTATYTLKWMS
ncbi:MAG: sulfite exporter TauE/SafE family protein [Calditrichaeota bacterium]|nr:sulfite exporter TauE/SafE family protein [Calditrichota bacterium]